MELKLTVTCEKCGHTYTLGKNALVVTTSGLLSAFTVVSGQPSDDNRNDPDLVAAFEGDYATIAPVNRSKQQAEIFKILMQTKKGPLRWWKCNKCGTVQAYPQTPSYETSQSSGEVRSSKARSIGCGILAVVLIGLCVFAVVMSQREIQREEPLARDAVHRFLQLIAEGKNPEAYKSMAREFRANHELEALNTVVKELRLQEDVTTTIGNFKFSYSEGYTLEGFVEAKDGRLIAFTMMLRRNDGEWRVLSLARSQSKK